MCWSLIGPESPVPDDVTSKRYPEFTTCVISGDGGRSRNEAPRTWLVLKSISFDTSADVESISIWGPRDSVLAWAPPCFPRESRVSRDLSGVHSRAGGYGAIYLTLVVSSLPRECSCSPGGVEPLLATVPSFIRFFCFIRLFWNHILTWVSLSPNAAAISIRRARVRYLLKWNSFSNSVSCLFVKFVRPMFGWPAYVNSPCFGGAEKKREQRIS